MTTLPHNAILPHMKFKSGFIAIIGRPNVGKSTFLNAVLGEKITIVSRRPQTTRNVIRGVKHLPGAQIVFIDTPGLHRATGPLNEFMVKSALGAFRDVDGILYVVEASREIREDDKFIINSLKKLDCPVILAVNKIDRVEKEILLPFIEGFTKLKKFHEVVPISALKNNGLNTVLSVISDLLPDGPEYFPPDFVTDQPERFIAAEMVREKVFKLTREEIPYSVAVEVEEFKERKDKALVEIRAVINVERDSQKGIIIGKKGVMLKKIGSEARHDIENLLGVKVFLQLFVKVKKGWTRNARALKDFGYH